MDKNCCNNIDNLSEISQFRHYDYKIGSASIYRCKICKDELLYDSSEKTILGKICKNCKGNGTVDADKINPGITFRRGYNASLLKKCDDCFGIGVSEEKIFKINLF